jgi:hypothetical protein
MRDADECSGSRYRAKVTVVLGAGAGAKESLNATPRSTKPKTTAKARFGATSPGEDVLVRTEQKTSRWKTTYHAPNVYRYKYDKLNRLESAEYNPSNAGPGLGAEGIYSV